MIALFYTLNLQKKETKRMLHGHLQNRSQCTFLAHWTMPSLQLGTMKSQPQTQIDQLFTLSTTRFCGVQIFEMTTNFLTCTSSWDLEAPQYQFGHKKFHICALAKTWVNSSCAWLMVNSQLRWSLLYSLKIFIRAFSRTSTPSKYQKILVYLKATWQNTLSL